MIVGASPSALSEYEAFAPYYDAFTAGSDYEKWTGHVLELAERLGLGGRTLLDLACGTGNSFVPFLRRGFEVTGSDVSGAMLAEAARKAPGTPLVHADVRELGRLGSFDLVTCFDDSLNYLLTERDLARALAAIAANLSPDGLALFDLNTLLAYRTTFAHDSVSVRDGTVFVWLGESSSEAAPGCRADARIDIFVPRDEPLYECVRVRHAQRHHPSERVKALMADVGLRCVGVHGVEHDGRIEPELDETRHLKVLYAARTEGTRRKERACRGRV
jgi:SAM-dependent methyltransferase